MGGDALEENAEGKISDEGSKWAGIVTFYPI